jgi:cytolysin-activating lysine-acyltransferase
MPGLEASPPTAQGSPAPPRTVSHMFGEMVWVMTQSPLHKHFALADLEWMVMPSLLLEQYRVFRDNERPVGVAFWAFVSEEVEDKVKQGRGRLRPDEWRSGDRGWLVELVAPFATAENQMVPRMLTDLHAIAFKGKPFSFVQTDPKTGERQVHTVGGETKQ